jgi:hypothetical protein
MSKRVQVLAIASALFTTVAVATYLLMPKPQPSVAEDLDTAIGDVFRGPTTWDWISWAALFLAGLTMLIAFRLHLSERHTGQPSLLDGHQR